MVVDEGIASALREADQRVVRIFAASCAERLVQVFCAARATDPSRGDDIAYVVETLEDLWDLRVPADSFDARRAHLLSFQELQPTDFGFTQIADIYSFYGCLILMYATKCAEAGGDPEAAISCAHASLAAMGQLDQNIGNATHFSNERARQETTLEELGRHTPLSRIRDNERLAAQGLVTTILDRVNGA